MVTTNGCSLQVSDTGTGPAVLLVHGWPHTHRVWDLMVPTLAETHRVVAPDLRGVGGSSREAAGYDAATLADDLLGLLDALGIEQAAVVALDTGVAPAFLLALEHPDRVLKVALMEVLIPGLSMPAGAAPPWWLGFHLARNADGSGLAETVLEGHEAEYLDHFLAEGTPGRGAPADILDAIVGAYAGRESLRCGFEYYRAIPTNADQVRLAVSTKRLTVPTMAVGGKTTKRALGDQLATVTDDLVGHVFPTKGHILPLDAPAQLLDVLVPFLS